MRIEDLKNKIVNKSIDDSPIIFLIEDNDFIPIQYINEISKIKNKEVLFVDRLENLRRSIFELDDVLKVIRKEKLESIDGSLLKEKNIFIISKNTDVDLDCIVKVPKLENWQIEDYAFSILKNIEKEKVLSFVENCNHNIYKVDNELKKLVVFDEGVREFIFNRMLEDGSFSESEKNISYDLVNSIVKKDISRIKFLLKKDLSTIDPVGITTLLLNQFRNIIKVQLSNVSSPETTGLKSNQFWAIKNLCNIYSKDQLVKIFMLLSSIDKKLKSSEVSSDFILDYIIINILNI